MITVYHWKDKTSDCTWSIRDAMIGEDTHYQACYFSGLEKPNYQLPALIGPVEYLIDNAGVLEIVIHDCDYRFDPRLCIAVLNYRNEVITDYPHDSPNYR